MEESDMIQNLDGYVWAKEFMRIFDDRKQNIDESLMASWFCNAIMCGYDAQQGKLAKITSLIEEIGKDAVWNEDARNNGTPLSSLAEDMSLGMVAEEQRKIITKLREIIS